MKPKIGSPEHSLSGGFGFVESGVKALQHSKPTIEQIKAELLAAGWVPKKHTIWQSPTTGQFFLGPAGGV